MTNTERESIVSVDTDLATLRRRLQFKSDMAALDRVEAELSRLREMLHGPDRVGQMWRRVEAAEARCARLQQALDHLLSDAQHHNLWWLENRIREALAGPDTPDYRVRFVWLIERGQSLNHAPTVWLCQEKPYDFSPDPLRAIRYPTREAAEAVIAEHTVGAHSPWAVAVEHGFADTPADSTLDCGHFESDLTSADGYTFCAVCAVNPGSAFGEDTPTLPYVFDKSLKRWGLFLGDLPNADWIEYVRHLESLAGPDTPADSQEDEWFIPEGDRQCGVVHKMARATCMKRRGHDGSHATPQGTWIDGPWCEYPADRQEDKT